MAIDNKHLHCAWGVSEIVVAISARLLTTWIIDECLKVHSWTHIPAFKGEKDILKNIVLT